jgi:type I restriction enzyme M protein
MTARRRRKTAPVPAVKPKRQRPVPIPETEVEAYGFIRENLRSLGWIVKNPNASTGGQVWTQNQCLGHPHLKEAFGLKRPENVVKVSESVVWVIEAKAARKDLPDAIDEAKTYYAKRLNDLPGCPCRALLATGVAGSEEHGYLIRTRILLNGRWQAVTINGQEATGLLSPNDVKTLFADGGSDIHEFAPPQRLFLEAAEHINEILHEGGINKNDRAKTIAALLLSVVDEPPNLDTKLQVLIAEINGRSEAVLKANGKPDFAPFIKILPPTNTTNHVKYRTAIVRTIQELQNLNIRSAMNSSTDVLGQFYEVFLKYGNGAKEIGIVLTPRHITRFAVEAVGVTHTDIVCDVACGTGGFLVAAFDHVRRTCTHAQLERFKEYNLFGIEQESYIAILAIVNMIFRGDGKHNITEGNCFTTNIVKRTVDGYASAKFAEKPAAVGSEVVTRVLMNPPFALRTSLDKEYRFVSRALDLMADGGILFALIPLGAMFREGDEYVWRKDDLLAKNTLLAVVSLPERLFVPAANKQVLAVVVKKGHPHPAAQPVFWSRVSHDGHIVVKSRRLPAGDFDPPRTEPNQLDALLPRLRSFIASPGSLAVNDPEFCKTAPIDFADPLLELIPEAYIDGRAPSVAELREAVDDIARETAAYLVKFHRENEADAFA